MLYEKQATTPQTPHLIAFHIPKIIDLHKKVKIVKYKNEIQLVYFDWRTWPFLNVCFCGKTVFFLIFLLF